MWSLYSLVGPSACEQGRRERRESAIRPGRKRNEQTSISRNSNDFELRATRQADRHRHESVGELEETAKRTGEEFTSSDDIEQLADGFSLGVSLATVDVSSKDTRVAVSTKKDERVGERLEPGCDGRLECPLRTKTESRSETGKRIERTLREMHSLSDLGIVVLDEGDSVHGMGLEERIVEDGANVVVLGLVSGLLEVVCFERDDKGQRHSEVVGSENEGTRARSMRKQSTHSGGEYRIRRIE